MQEAKPDFFDYIACVLIADAITAGIFSGSIFLFTFGVTWYILYENLRVKGIL